MRGIEDVVRELLEKGTNPNIKTKYGQAALIEAAFWGDQREILRLLLDAGAEINQTSTTGWTALMATAFRNRYEGFELLLDRGADVNMRSKDGRTALILAVRQRHTSIVERLLSVGADPNVIDGYGETPLGLAREAKDADLVRLLEQAGALSREAKLRRGDANVNSRRWNPTAGKVTGAWWQIEFANPPPARYHRLAPV